MKIFRIAVMLNGSESIDYYESLSNLWRIKEGLKSNANQAVLYYNLETALNTSSSLISNFFSILTGQTYIGFLEGIYKDLINKLKNAVYFNQVDKNGVVNISLFGFSEGATLARYFAVEYIKNRLTNEMPPELKEAGIRIKLDAEYLFDSVRLPAISGFTRYFKRNPVGYSSEIPVGTKAYHAVALDDIDVIDEPLLLDKNNPNTEEVWFAGDKLDIGGGHMLPAHDSPPGASDALNYVVMRARENGLVFKEDFLKTLANERNSKVLSEIHNRSWYLPISQRRVRAVYVRRNNTISDELPIVHESAIRRMQSVHEPDYQPTALLPFTELEVLKADGTSAFARFEDEPVSASPILARYERETSQSPSCMQRAKLPRADSAVDLSCSKVRCR